MDPQMEGIFDNYTVKRQIINSGYVKTFYLCFTVISFGPTYYFVYCNYWHIFPFSPIYTVNSLLVIMVHVQYGSWSKNIYHQYYLVFLV